MIALPQMRGVLAASVGGGMGGSGVTWNAADSSTGAHVPALSNGDLTLAGGSTQNAATRCTLGRNDGKYYFEVAMDVLGTASNTPYIGVVDDSQDADTLVANFGPFAGDPHVRGLFQASPASGGHVDFVPGAVTSALQPPAASGDVYMFALDLSLGLMWIGKNGTWDSGGDPAAGSGATAALPADLQFPAAMVSDGAHLDQLTAHFDAADMDYTIPSGFRAWADSATIDDYDLVWLQVTGDTADVSGGVAHDIGPLAGGSRGISLFGGATTSGGYIVVGTDFISAVDSAAAGLAMPWPARFSVEFTLNYPDVTTAQVLFDCRQASTNPGGLIMTLNAGGYIVYDVNTTTKDTVTGVFTANTDHDVGLFRDEVGGVRTIYIFVDGVMTSSYTDSSNYASQPRMFFFGSSFDTAVSGAGSKLKNIRIIRGRAVHTSNYTPSTPFPTS